MTLSLADQELTPRNEEKPTHLTDPVHGSIDISADEKDIIASYPFQRLRKIKQLGNTYLVFPGANHTRFAHSIGVMHVAGRLFDAMFQHYKTIPDLVDATKYLRKVVRAAGLLHDVGHGPYSHHFEKIFGDTQSKLTYKDWNSDFKIPDDWHGEKLNGTNLKHEHFSYCLIYSMFHEEKSFAQDICCLLEKKILPSDQLKSQLTKIAKFDGVEAKWESLLECLQSLLSSEIDADRIDYLLRDAFYCGVKIVAVDLDFLCASIELSLQKKTEFGKPEDGYFISLKANAVTAVEQILISRKQMYDQVYFHRVNAAFDYIMEKIMLALKQNGTIRIPERVDDFLRLHDQKIDEMIHKLVTSKQASEDEVEFFAQMLVTRTPMGRIEELIVSEASAPEKEHELSIRRPGKIIFKLPLKEFTKMSRTSGSGYDVIRVPSNTPAKTPAQQLSAYSRVVSSDLWTIKEAKFVVLESIEKELKTKVEHKLRFYPIGEPAPQNPAAQPSGAAKAANE